MTGESMSRSELQALVEALRRRVNSQDERIEQLAQQIEQQRYITDQLVTDLPTSKRSKRAKLFHICRKAAEDAPRNARSWAIGAPKAAGAADCSERHARNLMQELAAAFSWAEYDPAGKPKARLLVDYPDGKAVFLDRLPSFFPEVTDP